MNVNFENRYEVKEYVLSVLIPQINAELESDYKDDEGAGVHEIIDGLSEVIYTYQAKKISEAFDFSPFDVDENTGMRFESYSEMAYSIILESWREQNN